MSFIICYIAFFFFALAFLSIFPGFSLIFIDFLRLLTTFIILTIMIRPLLDLYLHLNLPRRFSALSNPSKLHFLALPIVLILSYSSIQTLLSSRILSSFHLNTASLAIPGFYFLLSSIQKIFRKELLKNSR